MKNRKSKYELRQIKLKTLLIYPPLQDISQLLHLGLPILQGFLKKKGYQNIELINLDYIYNTRNIASKIKRGLLCFYFHHIEALIMRCGIVSVLKIFLKLERIKRILGIDPPINQFSNNWSLNRILNLVAEEDSFCKKEVKKIYSIIKSSIINKNPDVVGISVTYPSQIFYSLLISKIIKEIKKETFIVLGGAQVNKHIKYLIQKKKLTEIIDGFVVGDGEEPLAHLIYQLSKTKNLNKVPGLYFKDYTSKSGDYYTKSNFVYSYNPHEIIIPDFSGFKIKNVLPIRASINCPWGSCTFCTYKKSHKKNIYSEPEHVVILIKSLIKKYKINNFSFIDDSLNLVFLKKFSELILEEGIKIRWNGFLCFQPELENEAFIRLIAKAGCKTIGLGMESMSPRILKLMNKPQCPKSVRKVLRLFKKYKIETRIFVMFGFPSETEEEAKITFDFLINEKKLYSSASPQQFTLEENTPIFKNFNKFGISKIYTEDKNYGGRLGFYYKTYKGMTLKESEKFVSYVIDVLGQKGKLAKRDFFE